MTKEGVKDKVLSTLEECGKYFLSLKVKRSKNDSCCKQQLCYKQHQMDWHIEIPSTHYNDSIHSFEGKWSQWFFFHA